MDGWGDPGAPPTPVPSLQLYCDWRLRDSDPGMASASMGSVFLCLLLTSSSFCPSSVFRESLGHSLSSGRPFYPSHPGLPCCPGILGLRAGAASRRPSSGEGGWIILCPSPLQGWLPSDRERSRGATPLIREATTRRCRAGFRRRSQFLSQRPQGFRPGDWDTAAAGPGGPVSHEAGRLTDLDRDMVDLPA
jgi:hypothetical protein